MMEILREYTVHIIPVIIALNLFSCGEAANKKSNTSSASATSSAASLSSHSETSSSYSQSTLKEQTLKFAQDTLTLTEGDNFTESVSAKGIGRIFYTSGDSAIATIDDLGEVTAISPGQSLITATIAQDHVYAQASASQTIKVVPKPMEMSVWVGKDKLTIDLPEEAKGYYLYRTNDKNCDFAKINECRSGGVYLITDLHFDDVFPVPNEDIYYSLVKNNFKATVTIHALPNGNGQTDSAITEFNNLIWRVDLLENPDSSRYNKIFYSNNGGRSWKAIDKTPEFQTRASFYSLVNFENKLWIMGGSLEPYMRYNDAWSTTDGISWHLEYDAGGSSIPMNYIEYHKQLWSIGGLDVGPSLITGLNLIRNSNDGISWSTIIPSPTLFNSYSYAPRAAIFDDKIWVLDTPWDVKKNTQVRHLLSSINGADWSLISTLDTDNNSSSYYDQLINFNGKLWIFTSPFQQSENIARWSSDGVNWSRANVNITGKISKIINYKDGLLAFSSDAVWFSTDALEWSRGDSTTFDFTKP